MSEKKKRRGDMETVKESFRKKALARQAGKGAPYVPTKKPKVKHDEAFFNPDDFSGDKPLQPLGLKGKGKQPEWVIERYGKN